MSPVSNHPRLFCKQIHLDKAMSNIFQAASSRLHVLLSISWNRDSPHNITELYKDSSVWSEDLNHQGFRACVLVANGSLHDDLIQPPSVHWSVFSKEFFIKDTKEFKLNINVGAEYLNTWSNGTQCQTIFNITATANSSSTEYNVFTSIEFTSVEDHLMGYRNAMTTWTDVIVEEKNSMKIKYFRACAKELQNRDVVHQGIVIVSVNNLNEPFDLSKLENVK